MRKTIIGIGAFVQIILFFSPLAESKIGTHSGWKIATDDSSYIPNNGLLWFLLLIPITLLICASANAKLIICGIRY